MQRNELGQFYREYQINEDFFDIINTEEKAYILGFFYADGTNCELNGELIGISFTQLEQDVDILEKIKSAMNADYNFYSCVQKTNEKIKYKFSINSKKLSKRLSELGAPPRKSLILKFPNKDIFKSEDLIRHFIRGYFDGDGSIIGQYVKADPKTNRQERIRRYFTIISKNNSILLEFKEFFEENNINVNINYLKRDDMWRMSTSSKKEVEKIFNLLYKNSNFYLIRKFDKFNYYVNTEVSQLIADHRNA